MRHFEPSSFSYLGAAAGVDASASGAPASTPAVTSESVEQSVYSQDAISALSTFLGINDPEIEAARVEQQIRNLQALIPTSVGPVRTYRLNQIAKLQAELQVLRAKAAESAYSTELTRVVRVSAAAGSVFTTLAILSGVFVVGFMAVSQVQKIRIQQAELQRLRGGT